MFFFDNHAMKNNVQIKMQIKFLMATKNIGFDNVSHVFMHR